MSRPHHSIERVANDVFGWTELHDEQRAAITAALDGHDVLAVLPTGAGKSAIYQVLTVLLDGLAVVVSPLLALHRDQIAGLAATDAPLAVSVSSATTAAQTRSAWAAVRDGSARFLFLSPEQLAKDEVVEELRAVGVVLFVVDEAHCVSAWGHDFRPDYLRLAPVIERLGHPRVVALTATAAGPVREDICTRLDLHDPREVVASFDRPNLHLDVHWSEDADAKQAAVVELVGELSEQGPGLVYTASRRDAEAFAALLSAAGIRAASYHAGLKAGERHEVQEGFLADELRVVVATSAFGMGIDKPDVRFVLHVAAPESLDSYYQQVGRAGRDGEPARIVLLWRPEDLHLQRFLTSSASPARTIAAVVRALAGGRTLSLTDLIADVDASRAAVTRAVNLLEQAGAIETTHGRRRGLRLVADARTARADARHIAERHDELTRSRVEMVRAYAETTGCRRQLLLGYFGEHLEQPCGACDNCEAGTSEVHHEQDGPFQVNAAVRHTSWGAGVVMSLEDDRVTVLFDEVGYRTLALEALQDGDILTSA